MKKASCVNMEDESWMPRAEEPMEMYMKSDRYRKSSAVITFSDFKGQEEANYFFWRHFSPAQRLELHTIMVTSLYADVMQKSIENTTQDIIFSDKYQ